MFYLQAGRPIMYLWVWMQHFWKISVKPDPSQSHLGISFRRASRRSHVSDESVQFPSSVVKWFIVSAGFRLTARYLFFVFIFPPSCDWQLPPPLGLRWRLWIFAWCHSTTSRSNSEFQHMLGESIANGKLLEETHCSLTSAHRKPICQHGEHFCRRWSTISKYCPNVTD